MVRSLTCVVQTESIHAVAGFVFGQSIVGLRASRELRLVSDEIYCAHCRVGAQEYNEVVSTTKRRDTDLTGYVSFC